MKKSLILILILICFTQCNSATEPKVSKDNKTEKSIIDRNLNEESVSEIKSTIDNDIVQIKEDTTIYDIDSIDVKPDFEGGIVKLHKFIRQNFKYPEEEGLLGQVNVNFIVEKDGNLSDIKITRDIGFGTGNETIRILKKCPKWFPGKQNDSLVRVRYYLTIPIDTNHE